MRGRQACVQRRGRRRPGGARRRLHALVRRVAVRRARQRPWSEGHPPAQATTQISEAESAAQTGRNGQAGSLPAIQQVQVLLGTSRYRHLDLLTYGRQRGIVSSHQHKLT